MNDEFDIHGIDKIADSEEITEDEEDLLSDYEDTLISRFIDSPEASPFVEQDSGFGFWAAQIIRVGIEYFGVTLPEMSVYDTREIVEEKFPEKITITSPEEADEIIPELIAFWEFLKREYKLPQSDAILKYLHKIKPGYSNIMNDPSRFGMAKAFVMTGKQMGFDMTNEKDMVEFQKVYNTIIQEKFKSQGADRDLLEYNRYPDDMNNQSKIDRIKRETRKKRRKLEKLTRKKNIQNRKKKKKR